MHDDCWDSSVACGRVPCSLCILLCGCRGVVVVDCGDSGRGLMRGVDENSMIGYSSDE